MNQNADEHGQFVAEAQTPTPSVVLPASIPSFESIDAKVDQLESNIVELRGEPPLAPTTEDASPFDATSYVQLSNHPNVEPACVEPLSEIEAQFAAADPYVNLVESNPADTSHLGSPIPTAAEMRQQSNAQNENREKRPPIIFDELCPAPPDAPIENANQTRPTVEFVDNLGVNESHEIDEPSIAPTPIAPTQPSGSQADNSNHPDPFLPPVTWFADSIVAPKSCQDPNSAIPLNNSQLGEPVFDIRDFSNAANGTIEPIPGSFEVDPELFDFKTGDELIEPSTLAAADAVPPTTQRDEDELFVAGSGDVIQIDGNDGYDHIDLACFDVQSATFKDNVIQIDDQQGSAFEVRYQNVRYALFAEGVQIDLI